MVIGPERFQRGLVFWGIVSKRGSGDGDWWLPTTPYLPLSKVRSSLWTVSS